MTTATFAFLRSTNGSFGGYLSALFAGIREGKEIARRYDALNRLSDAQLASLGLERSTLAQAAVDGAR
jgi:hypothetical protein